MKLKLQILLLLLVNVCYAQISQNDFKNITIKDGLSQSSVYSIYQDEKGFMWFGTFDGLNRYDGHSIKVYAPHTKSDSVKSLSHGYVKGLDGDKHGKIFIATYGGGLNVLDITKGSIVYYKNRGSSSIINNYLNTLLYVNDTTVWIATIKGVSRFNPQTKLFYNFPFKQQFSNEKIGVNAFCLFVDKNKDLWVGTYGNGLLKLNQKTGNYKYYVNTDGEKTFDKNLIRSVINFHDNLMLVSTSVGLYTFNPVTGEFKLYGFAGERLGKIIRDLNGGYWVTTAFRGLIRIEKDGSYKEFKNNPYDKKSFTDNRLMDVYSDNVGNVWVGTTNSGVIRVNGNRKQFAYIYHVANKPSIPENSIFGIVEDVEGRVWIGTEKGLSVWNREKGTFEIIGLRVHGVVKYDLAIWKLLLDKNSDLWIATSLGLIRYNVITKRQSHYARQEEPGKGLINDNIDCIGGNEKHLWVSTIGGLNRFDTETNKFVRYFADGKPNSISHISTRQIYTDSKGRVWFCTLDGLNLYNPELDGFKTFDFKNGGLNILSNDISSMIEVESGIYWLATSKGISVFDFKKGKIIRNISENDGLPNGYVYRMIDSGSTIWVSTNNGLAEINKTSFSVINSYYEEDGLQSNEFNPAAIKLRDGYFLFGGINGITGFYPDSIRKSGYVPPLYITGLSVFGKEITAKDTLRSNKIKFEKNIISASKIAFYPEEKMFSIRFSALDYSNSKRIKYYYRMLPISREWVSLGKRNFVTFVDLSPGKYTLEVKSTNGDGILCDNVKAITLVVQPPFWRRKWVVGIEIVLLIFVVYLIFKYRTYRLMKEKKNLEEVVAKRTREIARQKDKLEQFAANLEEKVNQRTTELKIAKQNAEESDRLKSAFLSNMSHEIRTPMNAILGFSELLSSPGFDEEERLGFAKMVKTNGDALLTLLNDIIDISMIESGQLKLNIVDVNVYSLVHGVYVVFKNSAIMSEKTKVSLDFNVKNDLNLFIKTDSQRLLQILNNLVGNALKFTDKGFVEIGYRLEDGNILFFVKDTGIGISEDGLSKIFDRFHKLTGDSKNIYGGNGLGLTITKNLVEALNGKIWVESTEGIGTAFYFSLPM